MGELPKFELRDSGLSKETKETIRKIGTGEYHVPQKMVDQTLEAQAQRVMKEGMDKEKQLEDKDARIKELEAELAALRKLTRDGPPTHEVGRKFIEDLRKQDIPNVNRTCRCCTRRLPLREMESSKVEFCNDCRNK